MKKWEIKVNWIKIAEICKDLHITQVELADYTISSLQSIKELWRGRVNYIQEEKLTRIITRINQGSKWQWAIKKPIKRFTNKDFYVK